MKDIKSKNARDIINNESYTMYGFEVICKGYATTAITTAEKEIITKSIEVINEAVCGNQCFKGKYCDNPCEFRDNLIKKLFE